MGDDLRFDQELVEQLSQLPLEQLPSDQVAPWKRALGCILWGMGLTSITVSFFRLQYILPAVGVVLLLLGFRALRRENWCFRLAWLASLGRAACYFASLTSIATPYQLTVDSPFYLPYSLFTISLQLSQCLFLWLGLRAVQHKAGRKASAAPAGALLGWYAGVVLLALWTGGHGGWFVLLSMLACYALILRSLWKLAHLLDETGYVIQAAPVRLSDRWLAAGYLLGLLLSITICIFYYSRYPMEWSPVSEGEQAGLEDIRASLLELGLPEEILNDLSAEELARYQGTVWVYHDTRRHYDNDLEDKALDMQDVAIRREDGSWRVLHYFSWSSGPRTRGRSCLEIWPMFCDTSLEYLDHTGAVSQWDGQVLFDRRGTTYAAPYYSLQVQSYETVTPFGELVQERSTFATFSPPLTGQNFRGYIAYDVEPFDLPYWYVVDSWCNYVHPAMGSGYPLVDPVEERKSGVLFNSKIQLQQTQLFLKLELWNWFED